MVKVNLHGSYALVTVHFAIRSPPAERILWSTEDGKEFDALALALVELKQEEPTSAAVAIANGVTADTEKKDGRRRKRKVKRKVKRQPTLAATRLFRNFLKAVSLNGGKRKMALIGRESETHGDIVTRARRCGPVLLTRAWTGKIRPGHGSDEGPPQRQAAALRFAHAGAPWRCALWRR